MRNGLGTGHANTEWLEQSSVLPHRQREVPMLRLFALLTLSACSVASASAAVTIENVRPTHVKDHRVFVTLVNKGVMFRDVKIDGHTYTLQPHELLTVKGPVGTTVYAASSFGKIHRGDALVALTPEMDHSRIAIN
jgi:hypothetical protein